MSFGKWPKKPEKTRVEVTLVWADGGECLATVPVTADEVMCGKHKFRRDKRRKGLVYNEVREP